MSIYPNLLTLLDHHGAGFFVLLDPDDAPADALAQRAALCEKAGVDALLVGGSMMVNHDFAAAVAAVKKACRLPLIIFPGGSTQLAPDADALLFLSLISGRNPRYLIEEQVQAAPAIRQLAIETIPTGYMLISSGTATAVEQVSGTQPLPRDNPDLAAAHALAGQYLGLKMIYLEAGSGAKQSVPADVITRVRQWIDLPLIVGGGIRSPEEAAEKVKAGADFIVIGTAFDGGAPPEMMEPFSAAIRRAARKRK